MGFIKNFFRLKVEYPGVKVVMMELIAEELVTVPFGMAQIWMCLLKMWQLQILKCWPRIRSRNSRLLFAVITFNLSSLILVTIKDMKSSLSDLLLHLSLNIPSFLVCLVNFFFIILPLWPISISVSIFIVSKCLRCISPCHHVTGSFLLVTMCLISLSPICHMLQVPFFLVSLDS